MITTRFPAAVAASFLIGWGCAYLVSRYGDKLGLADIPNERSAHFIPVPKGGGVGIPLAAALLYLFWGYGQWLYLLVALPVSLVSFINDIEELPAKLRLLIQVVAAAFAVIMLKTAIPAGGPPPRMWWPVILLVVWVVYIVAATNFFNFMDGINGIAGVEALLSFGFLGAYWLVQRGRVDPALLCFTLSAAVLGFLLLNFPGGKVFMGDVGSIFLGFLFALLVTAAARGVKELLVLALFQGVFYVDAVSTILLRLRDKENILSPHKKHLYQRLVHDRGFSHTRVVGWYFLAQGLTNLAVLVIVKGRMIPAILVWLTLSAIYWFTRVKLNLVRNLK